MGSKICIRLAAGISLLVLASVVWGQDEQWLQYRVSAMAREVVGDMGSSSSKLMSEQPEGIELLEFKCDEPLFAKWSSPMARNGHLWIAFDRSQKDGSYDLLYIDSNGDRSFKDETEIKCNRSEHNYVYFGPAKVTFEGEDGPLTYHLNFRLYISGQRKYLWISPGGWYEGAIKVGREEKYCVLIDQNVNGTFDDKSLNAHESDRIQIGRKGRRDTSFVGKYIEIDDKLYSLEVARDGAYIKLSRAEDVTFGDIRLPRTITDFAGGGENGLFIRKPEKGAAKLPVGKYRIDSWAIERKDEKGDRWRLEGRWFGQKGVFDVAETEETELTIGEPIISTLEAQDRRGTHYFSQNLAGQLGERIELTCNGTRAPAPKLHIKSSDGNYDRSFSFEYG